MASTKVASIMVAGLTCTALYVDHFVCEAYSDSGLTHLVAQASAVVKNVAGTWTQQGSMTLSGLTQGTTYFLRAGVVAPQSGFIDWSSTFSLAAGSTTAPAPSFTFTSNKTGSGVSYVVTPASIPSDIDHYEAWWTLNATTPALAQKPMWKGPLNNGTTFSFFVGCHSTQTPTVYVRAVNTSMVQQAWFELELTSGGTFDNIVDGGTYVKLKFVNATNNLLTASTALTAQGSIAQTGINVFAYVSTTTSITWSWSSYTIYAPDGSSISIGGFSAPSFTGLTSGTTYNFGFYYNIATSATVVVLSDVSGGTGASSIQQTVQTLNGDGRVCVAINIPASTTTSGGGGGGGGGHGVCFSATTRIVTRDGHKAIEDICVGDEVFTARNTWRPVTKLYTHAYDGSLIDMGQGEGVTAEHRLRRRWWLPAAWLPEYTKTFWYKGTVHNLEVSAAVDDDGSTIDTEHSYTLRNGECAHNFKLA